jgi:hypothetical protein
MKHVKATIAIFCSLLVIPMTGSAHYQTSRRPIKTIARPAQKSTIRTASRKQPLLAKNTMQVTKLDDYRDPTRGLFKPSTRTTRVATIKTAAGKTKPAAVKKKASLLVDMNSNSKLYKGENGIYEQGAEMEATAGYAFNGTWSLSLYGDFVKDYHSSDSMQAKKTILILGQNGFKLTPNTTISFSEGVALPVDAHERIDNSYLTTYSLRSTFVHKLTTLPRLTYSGYIDGLKTAYKYDTNEKGEANLSYRGRIAMGLDYSVTDKLTFSVGGFYQAGRTYLNSLSTFFFLAEEVAFSFTKEFSMYVAHANLGSGVKANGIDSNIELYNPGSSTVAAGIRVSL